MGKCTYGSSRKWITCFSHLFLLMWCLTTSFDSTSLLFNQTTIAHYMLKPTSSNCIILFCLLFKILRFTPISWPIAVRFQVEFDTTMLETTILAFSHQHYDNLWYLTNLLSYCQLFQKQFHIALNYQIRHHLFQYGLF
jgi:hypothetical protein